MYRLIVLYSHTLHYRHSNILHPNGCCSRERECANILQVFYSRLCAAVASHWGVAVVFARWDLNMTRCFPPLLNLIGAVIWWWWFLVYCAGAVRCSRLRSLPYQSKRLWVAVLNSNCVWCGGTTFVGVLFFQHNTGCFRVRICMLCVFVFVYLKSLTQSPSGLPIEYWLTTITHSDRKSEFSYSPSVLLQRYIR